jgi:Glycosyltransferase family 10 (fucosyltransferase) C-term
MLISMIKVAFCNDIYEFGGNRLANKAWSAKFPGAGWVYEFYRLANHRGWELVTGEIAYSNVRSGYWKANDVLVIQELNSSWGGLLIQAGAQPFLQTCFESPLYAWSFFDRLSTSKSLFKKYMLPISDKHDKSLSGDKFPLCFPSHWVGDIVKPKSWSQRREIVLIASNKYWSSNPMPSPLRLKRFINWCKSTLLRSMSPSFKLSQSNQLHDKRLEAIEYFSKDGRLTIYGSGWSNLFVLPTNWRQRLSQAKLVLGGKVDSKAQTQAEYKYALCFENTRYPGYVTEKIIDCYVAGVIPIYMGAPDIECFVPKGSFIDLTKFSSLHELDFFLNSLSDKDAAEIIARGREFLKSEAGVRHSYEGFAKWIVNEIEKSFI